jgi:chorismate mutase
VAATELETLRRSIDEIDSRLLNLIEERVKLVLAVGDYKREHGLPIYDPERERKLIHRLTLEARAPLEPDTVRRIFERLIDESRRLEQHHASK